MIDKFSNMRERIFEIYSDIDWVLNGPWVHGNDYVKQLEEDEDLEKEIKRHEEELEEYDEDKLYIILDVLYQVMKVADYVDHIRPGYTNIKKPVFSADVIRHAKKKSHANV